MSTQPVWPQARRRPLPPRTIALLLGLVVELFVVGAAVLLYVSPFPLSLTIWHLVAVVGAWNLAWFSVFWMLGRRLASYDYVLLLVAAGLTGWGLIMQARLAPAVVYRQVVWLLVGCCLLCGVALYSDLARTLRRYRYTLLTAGIILLGATLVFGVNPSGYGQRLWLGAFGLYLQPSEPLKVLLVIFLAAYLAEKRALPVLRAAGKPIWSLILGPMLVMIGLSLVLLGWQQDLGAALLFYLTSLTMITMAWGKWRYALLGVLLFIPVGVAGYLLSARIALRVSIWLDPWAPEQVDRAFQILQSLFAFSAGGLLGRGLGYGVPGMIPAVHTDFVYAALVEEFGLAGGLAMLALVAAFVYRGFRIAQRSSSDFESLLAGGLAALIGVQTWVITGGNAKLIPITGITLPFMSHGGSSLVTMLVATGILINLSSPHPVPLAIKLATGQTPPVARSVAALGKVVLLLLGSIALATGNWAIVRAEELRGFLTNPRFVLAETRIRRGQILDRNLSVLAGTTLDELGYVTRTYPVPSAAPAVGFASLVYGTDGIESACDARLRGDIDRTPWDTVRDGLLHVDPTGRDVRLTLDADLQAAAQDRLRGEVGAAVLIDAHTGEILVLASSPSYDPADVDDAWDTLRDAEDSPLLNRATQALAQPGTVLQPFILASALERGLAEEPAGPITKPVAFDGRSVTCRAEPATTTWESALEAGCPFPFVDAAGQLGAGTLEASLGRWGLLDAPPLEIATVAADVISRPLDVEAEALGQGELVVTPLQIVQAMAALGNEGVRPPLQLLMQPLAGCVPPETHSGVQVIGASTAETVRGKLASYGEAIGHGGLSIAGEDRQQAWFVGLNSATVPRYAVAVHLDRSSSPQAAASLGIDLLRGALGK